MYTRTALQAEMDYRAATIRSLRGAGRRRRDREDDALAPRRVAGRPTSRR